MMRTRSPVHDEQQSRRLRQRSLMSAQRTMAAMMSGAQLLLWLTFFGYDRSMQAVWQAALLLIVPYAALYVLWKKAAPALDTKGGRFVPLMLLPCLLADAVFVVFALGGFISRLIPQYSPWVGVAVPCAMVLAASVLARPRGAAYGAYALKGLVVILLVFATVFLRASNRADRLWPLWGKGVHQQALTALHGAGCTWGAAILFLWPKSAEGKAARFVLLPWAAGAVWALWQGFVRPWAAGDVIAVAEKMMGLARHAHSVTLYEIAGLLWLVLLPLALCGALSVCEVLTLRAFPACPRALPPALLAIASAAVMLFVPQLVLPVLEQVLPWRAAMSAACAAALWICARKEAKA